MSYTYRIKKLRNEKVEKNEEIENLEVNSLTFVM